MRPPRPGPLGLACLALLSPLLFSASISLPGASDFWAPGEAGERAEALLEEMSDEEVLGQLFMLAYPGNSPPPLLYDWIEKRGLGGVKIFGWNADDTDALARVVVGMQLKALESGKRIPLLIATDQEGGWIRHVKGKTSQTPGNMAIGASGRPYDAYWSAYYIGRELEALGINMNFAPTVDLATRPKSAIIGPRAFSPDPREAAVLGAAYAAGMSAAHVIPTAKHFPGHGDTELDSHGTLPAIDLNEDQLWERELLPFRFMAAEGLPAVMSGHLAFPKIEQGGLPASLSPRFMTDILRKRMGFTGLAVTDDLFMAGAQRLGFAESCYRAISAGNDLLMASRLIPLEDAAWRRLLQAYRREPAFRARAREAASRVLTLKLERLRPRGEAALVPDLEALPARVPDPEGKAFFEGLAFRAASSPEPEILPWKPEGKLLLVGSLTDFFEAAGARYPKALTHRLPHRLEGGATAAELTAFVKAAAACDSVLVCLPGDLGMDIALKAAGLKKRVAVLSILSPAALARRPPGMPAVAVYGVSPDSLEAGLAALGGEEAVMGRIPIGKRP